MLRELFYGSLHSFVFSISHVANWNANGGKSGASFYRTLDDRFVIKHISSTEMQVRAILTSIVTRKVINQMFLVSDG